MKNLSVRQAVVAALGKLGSASTNTLVSMTGKPRNQVQTALWKLRVDGKLKSVDGVHTLSADNKSKPAKSEPAKIKLPKSVTYKTAPVTMKLDEVSDDLGNDADAEFSKHAVTMAKYLDALAVIRYLEGKIAKRDANA